MMRTGEKARLRIEVAANIAKDIEGRLEAAQSEVKELRGAAAALKKAADVIKGLQQQVNKDVDAGKFNSFGEPLVVVQMVNDYIGLAISSVLHMAKGSEQATLRAQGKEQGVQMSMEHLHKFCLREQAEIEQQVELARKMENGEGAEIVPINQASVGRAPGGHPGPSIKTQRQAASMVQEAAEVKEPDDQKTVAETGSQPPPKQKRKRRTKAQMAAAREAEEAQRGSKKKMSRAVGQNT